MATSKLVYVGIAVVLAAVIAYGAYEASAYTVPNGKSYVAVQLTDPPLVPGGTQSLYITYSALQLHVVPSNGASANSSTSGWVTVNSSSSVNLMSLINVSEVIGSAFVNTNSTVNMVRFNITSANITVNGTTYPVAVLPNAQITAHVAQNSRVNSSTAGALVDLTPTVITLYTNSTANTTSQVFVMVPSVRMVVIPGVGVLHVGAVAHLRAQENDELNASVPSIAIESATLSATNSSTSLAVTVKDTSNSSVVIKHVLLFGNETAQINFNVSADSHMHSDSNNRPTRMMGLTANSYVSVSAGGTTSTGNASISSGSNVSSNSNANGSGHDITGFGANGSIGGGASVNSLLNATLNSTVSILHSHGKAGGIAGANISIGEIESDASAMAHIETMRTLNFLVGVNGTLLLPFTTEDVASAINEGQGFTLQPGQTATLTFSGPVTFANGHITVKSVPGDTYRLVVVGEEGIRASFNVTAA